jgi:hypothetical protein
MALPGVAAYFRRMPKVRTAFQGPIELDADPVRAEDDRYVKANYREVCASIQTGMDALARRRRLPLFG